MANPPATTGYRVFVSTDLGGDPDDIQSLYRLVHYSDVLRVEGIISSPGPGAKPSAELIRHWIERIDVEAMRANGHSELMRERELLACVRQGHTRGIEPADGRSSEGSEWLVRCANAPDPEGLGRPLWVLTWGSTTDLAQALFDDPGIAKKIRVHTIGSNNTKADPASRDFIYAGLAERWPELWWIEAGIMPPMSHDTFRGVYQGGDQSGEWSNVAFVEKNIRGRGTMHGGDFAEKCGDAFPVADWPKGTLKEGDSPSMLYLMSSVVGGVGNVDDPTGEGWGGRYRKAPAGANYYCDLDAPAAECQATVSKWRRAFLEDWKKRWGWYGG